MPAFFQLDSGFAFLRSAPRNDNWFIVIAGLVPAISIPEAVPYFAFPSPLRGGKFAERCEDKRVGSPSGARPSANNRVLSPPARSASFPPRQGEGNEHPHRHPEVAAWRLPKDDRTIKFLTFFFIWIIFLLPFPFEGALMRRSDRGKRPASPRAVRSRAPGRRGGSARQHQDCLPGAWLTEKHSSRVLHEKRGPAP
jgi:hypothetical protein